MKRKILLFFLIVVCGLGFFVVQKSQVFAYQIQKLTGTEIKNDFVLGPGKVELFMKPGERVKKEIYVTNRSGKDMTFKVEIEDFRGSRDLDEVTVLLGDEKGPYSLKDYIHPEILNFSLKHGERMILPVEVAIPNNAEPGGLYGSVIITDTTNITKEQKTEKERVKSQTTLISRLSALFFVRVAGDVAEDGSLKSFKTDKNFYEQSPINFEIQYENNGSIHENAYGLIEINNFLGKKVEEIRVDPFFAMPDSIRKRSVEFNRKWLIGRYSATLKLNRGYQDIIDEKTVTFWVIPWKLILLLILVIAFIIWLMKKISSKFEIRKKRK